MYLDYCNSKTVTTSHEALASQEQGRKFVRFSWGQQSHSVGCQQS